VVGGPLPEFVVTCDVEEVPPDALPVFVLWTLMMVCVWEVEPPIPGFMDFPTVLPLPDDDPVEPEVLPEVVPEFEPEVGVWP
jgi:hypothetical protein